MPYHVHSETRISTIVSLNHLCKVEHSSTDRSLVNQKFSLYLKVILTSTCLNPAVKDYPQVHRSEYNSLLITIAILSALKFGLSYLQTERSTEKQYYILTHGTKIRRTP